MAPQLGSRVSVTVDKIECKGTVRYFGTPKFAPGEWVGLQLDSPHGKNDGSVKGERLFECEMGYGLFARAHQLTVLSQSDEVVLDHSDVGTAMLVAHLKVKVAKDMDTMQTMLALIEELERSGVLEADVFRGIVGTLNSLCDSQNSSIIDFKSYLNDPKL